MKQRVRVIDKHGEARESLTLPPDVFEALDKLAIETNSLAKAGPNAGSPSWRALIRRLARGEFKLVKVEVGQYE